MTAEDDEKLKSLKAENRSWKEIAKEMKKPQGVLKDRWKEIDPNKDGGGSGKKDDAGAEEEAKKKGEGKDDDKPAGADEPKQMTKKEKKAAAKAAKEEAAAQPAEEPKPASNDGGGGSNKGAAKPASKAPSRAGSAWVTLQEDDLFSFGELQLLSELIARYDVDRWGIVASRFFDKTGRRVHPDDVRDKFVGSGF